MFTDYWLCCEGKEKVLVGGHKQAVSVNSVCIPHSKVFVHSG